MGDRDWTLSFLSSVAGIVTATSGEGDKTRMFSWGAPNSSNYWMHYIIDDNGKEGILVHEEYAPEDMLYTIMGYGAYHDINVEVD